LSVAASLSCEIKKTSTTFIRCLSDEAVANFSSIAAMLFLSNSSSSEMLRLNSSLAGCVEKCVNPISVK
jgi:hypothetical protein